LNNNSKRFVNNILSLLDKKDKNDFLILSIYILTAGLFEIINLLSISLFLKTILNPNYLIENNILNNILSNFGKINKLDLQFSLAIVLTLILILSSFLTVLSNWKTYNCICNISNKLEKKIFFNYLNQDSSFHFLNDKSLLIKKSTYDLERTITGVLTPILTIISKLISTLFIIAFLLYVNFYISIFIIFFLFLFYFFFYKFIKNKLSSIGFSLTEAQTNKIKILHESFGGIKEIILTNSFEKFYKKYSIAVESYNKKFSDYLKLSQLPRAILELISIIIIILILIVMLKIFNSNIDTVLPIIGVYALGGLRAIPAIQTLFQSVAQIKSSLPSLNLIYKDFEKSSNTKYEEKIKNNKSSIVFNKEIILKNISFSYPLQKNNTINKVSLKIRKNQFTSIIGPNGSGKSTLVNIILGILNPQKGSLFIDNLELNQDNKYLWQKKIGYVSQDIFLFDDTIFNNITFGLNKTALEKIDIDQILKISKLDILIKQLPQGINTRIGENGVYLSGGQRQKIAIARCLIKDAEIIIFDEATSVLDFESENNLNNIILNYSNKKTLIIISHKFENIKNSDIIYFIEEGSIKKSGKYKDIFEV
jgi:HlyD family secretion protein